MDRYLICQICGEKLSFNPSCTCSLGEHLINKHPGVEMGHFVAEDLSCCKCESESGSGLDQKASMARRNKSGIFKTTIETWKPGPSSVTCPKCGKKDRPCIRRERNKVAYTQLGAMCMISCWPICFLPCMMPQSSAIHLYCKHCGAFIGEYSRQNGTIKFPSDDADNKRNVPNNLC